MGRIPGDLVPALTRRQALQLGAGAGLAMLLGGPAAAARAAGSSRTPAFLRRASYAPLVGERFRVGGATLRLTAVEDLAGAAADAALRAHPEAFALSFDGPAGALEAGTHDLFHPALGSFGLLLGPAGAADAGVQRYEIVVDRSIGVPDDPPAPDPRAEPAPERPGTPEAAAAAVAAFETEQRREARRVARRRATRRRRARTRRVKARGTRKARRTGARRRPRHLAVRRGRAKLVR